MGKQWMTSLGMWGVGAGTAALFVRCSLLTCYLFFKNVAPVAVGYAASEEEVPRQCPTGESTLYLTLCTCLGKRC